jgi:hypothetical protein
MSVTQTVNPLFPLTFIRLKNPSLLLLLTYTACGSGCGTQTRFRNGLSSSAAAASEASGKLIRPTDRNRAIGRMHVRMPSCLDPFLFLPAEKAAAAYFLLLLLLPSSLFLARPKRQS